MCGIAGIVDFGKPPARETIAAMTGLIRHRGPDDEGIEIFVLGWKKSSVYRFLHPTKTTKTDHDTAIHANALSAARIRPADARIVSIPPATATTRNGRPARRYREDGPPSACQVTMSAM